MPRYFFNLRGGDVETKDEEGAALLNDGVARDRALGAARDILAAYVLGGRLVLDERIEIQDATGRVIDSVSLSEAVGLPRPQATRSSASSSTIR